ncbi:MAG: hypothetical protein J2P17_20910 [Mycobacterium sp.]|nr:hypothetical protein [Mycobacterium sp.]
MQVRIARQTGQLDRVVAFYRDRLGLPEIDRFIDHGACRRIADPWEVGSRVSLWVGGVAGVAGYEAAVR